MLGRALPGRPATALTLNRDGLAVGVHFHRPGSLSASAVVTLDIFLAIVITVPLKLRVPQLLAHAYM